MYFMQASFVFFPFNQIWDVGGAVGEEACRHFCRLESDGQADMPLRVSGPQKNSSWVHAMPGRSRKSWYFDRGPESSRHGYLMVMDNWAEDGSK